MNGHIDDTPYSEQLQGRFLSAVSELRRRNPCEFELPSGNGAPGVSYEKQQEERKRQHKNPFDFDLDTLVADSEDSLEPI